MSKKMVIELPEGVDEQTLAKIQSIVAKAVAKAEEAKRAAEIARAINAAAETLRAELGDYVNGKSVSLKFDSEGNLVSHSIRIPRSTNGKGRKIQLTRVPERYEGQADVGDVFPGTRAACQELGVAVRWNNPGKTLNSEGFEYVYVED